MPGVILFGAVPVLENVNVVVLTAAANRCVGGQAMISQIDSVHTDQNTRQRIQRQNATPSRQSQSRPDVLSTI